MTKPARRKRGRPPKPAAEVKRHPLGVRTTKALKEKLEAAAAITGRSVAQEVELRLEQSFEGPNHISIPLGFLRTLIEAAENRTGQSWTEDYSTWFAVSRAATHLLKIYAPEVPNRSAIIDTARAVEEEKATWTEEIPGLGLPSYPRADESAPPTERFLGFAGNYEERRKRLDELQAAADDALAPAVAMRLEGSAVFEEIADLFRLTPRKD